jgi:hypothetical protein
MQFRNRFEQGVGENLYVGPDARQERAQGGAIEHAGRMVGHRHQRALGRDAIEVRGRHFDLYPHFREQCLEAEVRRGRPYATIQVARFFQGNQLPGKSLEARKQGRLVAYPSPFVTRGWQYRHSRFSLALFAAV